REHDVNIRPWLRVYKSEKNPFKKFLYYLEYNRWMRYEPEIIKQFDSVLTFTETDSQFLNDVARVNHVHCHPRGIEVPEAISPYASREPLSLLFVGVYNHVANRDSVLWLCSEIFPEIQKRSPQATLYVVGKHPPDEVVEMASHNPGIKVMGFVPAIEEYYNRMQVFISPVRLGGGIKTKVLHAQSYGMAIVANSIGCEGITSVNPSTAIISDTVEGLADGVVALFNNPQQAASMAERGRELVVQQYGWTSVIKNLELFYQSKK
ncbi:MAG: glycosyltransferase, partial [Bacteroidetes bacterium]